MRFLKIAAALALAVVLVVLGARAFASWEAGRERTLPAPTGPFTVGRRSFSWNDTTRADAMAPDPTATRELVAWVWYPAVATPERTVAAYLPPAWLTAVPHPPRGQRLDRVRSHALDAAAVAGAPASYPLLIFSPGLGNLPTNYTTLLADVASHGYVVVAVAHPYSTTTVVFPDGRVARDGQSRLPFRYEEVVTVLAWDLVSVLNHVSQEHIRGDPVFSRADPRRAGVFGHSFGGAAAAQACAIDTRFVAGVDLDGTIFGPVMRSGVIQPFLLMMGELGWTQRFRTEPFLTYIPSEQARQHEEQFVARSPRASWLNVAHLTHMNFADEAYFYATPHRLLELLGARLDGRETHTLASAYVRAFFGRFLGGTESRGQELDRPSGGGLHWVARKAR